MTQPIQPSLSYKDAGVDIEAGDQLVERIKAVAKKTTRPEILGGLGGFGALCKIPKGYNEPVLVSGTDGVGTKLRLALELNRHDTLGIDLVAMCVNDLLVCGAEPLFFLDYYATGHLNVDIAAQVITGIAEGCLQAGCALAGGETAEMPGMYAADDYDLAGFAVGVVEQADIIDGQGITAGQVLIGLASSGPHSNGYSLIRKILDVKKIDINRPDARLENGQALADVLMQPTRIYVKPVLALAKKMKISGMAHITGGGLPGNVPRVLPAGIRARIDTQTWTWPPVFKWLQQQGNVDIYEMYRTFNCGVGMVLIVNEVDAQTALDELNAAGETAWIMGKTEADAASTLNADDTMRVWLT